MPPAALCALQCVLEQGACEAVDAHLAWARREKRLPADLQRAVHSRAKLTDIGGESIRHVQAQGTPEEVLKHALHAVGSSSFTRPEDEALVHGLLNSYDATLKRAVDEPPTCPADIPTDPNQAWLTQRPVFHPPSAPAGIYARPLKVGGEVYSAMDMRPLSARSARAEGLRREVANARPQSAAAGAGGSRTPLV